MGEEGLTDTNSLSLFCFKSFSFNFQQTSPHALPPAGQNIIFGLCNDNYFYVAIFK